jgi:hypothetical protein
VGSCAESVTRACVRITEHNLLNLWHFMFEEKGFLVNHIRNLRMPETPAIVLIKSITLRLYCSKHVR